MIYYPSNAGIAGGLIGGLLYIITSFSSFVISSSGEIIDTKDMALRYLLISIPLAIAIFYALYVQFKRIKRRNLVIG